MFERAAKLMESINHRPTDDEMLGQLRSLLISKGRLSAKVIDDEMHKPKSRCFLERFGSLRTVYNKLGYVPARDFSFLDVNRFVKVLHGECLDRISSQLQTNGAVVLKDPQTGILRINEDFTLRLMIAKCDKRYGRARWRIRQESSCVCDLTVAARMSVDNSTILDYYLFPKSEHLQDDFFLEAENSIVLDVYRFTNLDHVYEICRRKEAGESK